MRREKVSEHMLYDFLCVNNYVKRINYMFDLKFVIQPFLQKEFFKLWDLFRKYFLYSLCIADAVLTLGI